MNPRKQRAKQMMESSGYASQFESNRFKVRSQTNPNTFYIVSKTDNGLVCECKDHSVRKADCKHIKIVLELIMKNKCYRNNVFRIMERSQLNLCKYCDSGRITKKGTRKNKNCTVQIFKCLDCKKKFSANHGFEKTRFDVNTITGALQMYYSGMSTRDISNHYEMMGIEVSDVAIYKWICKYSTMVSKYLNEIIPRTGNWVRADEVWIKVAGKQKYLFASMDDDTRYWLASDMADTKFQHNADNLLKLTKEAIGKNPTQFITDGLPAYRKSSKRIFGKKTQHTRHIHIQGDMNNNKMERLNGEIRDREKVFRGLKKKDTPIIDGMKAYYNFTKKHGALKGKTPSEEALIKVDGKNRWKTIIQNASLHKANSN
ncbi:transposase [Nitrosopumilus sp. b3]|uniref:DDE-type integrase/transposase/recombinase n=1 Tax=Nitrosopumilus sp. b3 TaxID=2109909 RepID=UPI0015F6013C|nr:DDE-type integrase/transposase/recombinase [Nitrosopumilus sp. b3]KAF6246382.1 transposase [Nitrosopumilus sp. b3]